MADREHHQQQHHLQQQHQPHHAGHYQPGQHQQFHPTDAIKNLLPEKGPSTSQVLAVVTLFPIGGILLTLAGLTLAGTVIGLAVATPLFIIFSPVLVPAALTIGLAVTGFLASGAFGVTGLSSMSWIFNYVRELINPEQARRKMQEVAQKTKEYGQQIQSKAHEVGQKPEGARDQAARKPI